MDRLFENVREEATTESATADAQQRSTVIVTAGGTQSTGKSLLTAYLGMGSATLGHRVLLIDAAEPGGALSRALNVSDDHTPFDPTTLLGENRVIQIGPSVWLYAGGHRSIARFSPTALGRLYSGFDLILIDGGRAFHSVDQALGLGATHLLAVTTEEWSAVIETYAVLRLTRVHRPGTALAVVVNRVQHVESSARVFEVLEHAAETFLGAALKFLGAIPEYPLAFDPALRWSGDPPSGCIREAVAALAAQEVIPWIS